MGGGLLPIIMAKIMQANAQKPMSEQIPGGGTPTMPAGMPQMPTPMAMPAAASQQQPQQMQNAASIFGQQPNVTSEATRGPTPMPRPVMPGEMGKTEWETKAGRNMAITGSAIQSFSNAFQAGQQKNWERTASQAEQLYGSYLAMQKALADAQDPASKQAIQQQLQQMLEDPKTQKILKKAHSDPTSPEGVGVQRGMRMSQQQAEFQQKLATMMSEMQRNQAEAQKAQAEAVLRQSQVPQTAEERGVAMGTMPSADVKQRMAEMAYAKQQEMEYKRDKLSQDYELTKERLADQRASAQERNELMRELGQQRLDMTRMMLEFRMQQYQEKSRIPATLVSRFNQAGIIKEQVQTMREMLDDPELRNNMGPMKGIKGTIARYTGNRKVADFYAAQESLDALLPILHGYRGGAQAHAVFKRAMGTLLIDPDSYKGSLDALDKITDNVLTEGREMFPNDPLWRMMQADAAASKPETATPAPKGGAKPPDHIVTPEDMAK